MQVPVSEKLIHWYRENGRDLPWRNHRDPYAILVSEIMLQQTRVETVIPYYLRWMERFPDFETLAAADSDEVLSSWEGLGYYRRAQNLQRTARLVQQRYAGRLPEDPKVLRTLPGIGEYTAAAIAVFVYHQDLITMDGNLKRVLARLFGIALDLSTAEGKRVLEEKARSLLPVGKASEFNQALMDLGAGICLPGQPLCDQCPVSSGCVASMEGSQDRFPVKKRKAVIPHYMVTAGVLFRGEQVLLARRPAGVLLAGMWEFPGGKQEEGESLEACLQRELAEELGIVVSVAGRVGVFKHAYTHYRVTVYAHYCMIESGEPSALEHDELAWVSPQEFRYYPMGKVDRLIAERLIQKE